MLNETIEALLDRHGPAKLLFALAVVADEKAAHLNEAWQDKSSGSHWEAIRRAVDACERKIAPHAKALGFDRAEGAQ